MPPIREIWSKKWLRRTTYALATLTAACAIVYFDHPVVALRLPSVYARAEASGWPMTQLELLGEPIPDERNAALGMMEAGRQYEFDVLNNGCLDTEDPEVLQECLDLVEPLMDQWKAATALPEYRPPREFDLGLEMVHDDAAGQRRLAQMLARRAELLAALGETESVISDMEALMRGIRHWRGEPTAFMYHAAIRVEEQFLQSAKAMMQSQSDPRLAKQLLNLHSELKRDFEPNYSLKAAFYSNVVLTRQLPQYGGVGNFIDYINWCPAGKGEGAEPPGPRKVRPVKDGMPESIESQAVMVHFLEGWLDLTEGNPEELTRDEITRWSKSLPIRDEGFRSGSHALDNLLMPLGGQGLYWSRDRLMANRLLFRYDAARIIAELPPLN